MITTRRHSDYSYESRLVMFFPLSRAPYYCKRLGSSGISVWILFRAFFKVLYYRRRQRIFVSGNCFAFDAYKTASECVRCICSCCVLDRFTRMPLAAQKESIQCRNLMKSVRLHRLQYSLIIPETFEFNRYCLYLSWFMVTHTLKM